MTTEMGVKEYADLRGISQPAVIKAIKLGHKLPGVTGKKRFGSIHVLTVDKKKLTKNLQVMKK